MAFGSLLVDRKRYSAVVGSITARSLACDDLRGGTYEVPTYIYVDMIYGRLGERYIRRIKPMMFRTWKLTKIGHCDGSVTQIEPQTTTS